MAAIGIVETRGFTAAAEALDTMCKDARVTVTQLKRPGGGHVTIIAEGEVAAVMSAVEAGKAAACRVGGDVICTNVIPNPHPDLEKYIR
jgi:ethanolamine utilization protein EutM